jgi:thiamine transport system permease protein
MVIGTGIFLVFLAAGHIGNLVLVAIVLVNAVMVLPYAVRGVAPVLIDAARQHDRLCEQLGITGWQRFKRIDWPAIRRPTGFAAALGGALSFGDMGVAALFDTTGAITLPVMLYHRMGAYRFDEAAATALVLLLLTVGVFLLIDRGLGRWRS